jgi:glucose-1-phosphate adenylyltransferase
VQDVLSLILGGGRGAGLYPLTKYRSEPAVPLAGKYRLIDIPVSNCINSGIKRIYVVTQFLSVSLHRHLSRSYKFDPFSRGFVEVLAAQQTNETAHWYSGIADAVRQNRRALETDPCEDVLVLYGDQLYRMDFRQMLQTHRQSGADVTLAVLPVSAERAAAYGIARPDETGRIVDFVEKPGTEEQRRRLRVEEAWLEQRGSRAEGRPYLASMGIYLFKREALAHLLDVHASATDLATEIFPRSLHTHRFQAHLFDGYWQDLGTIKSYFEVNLALAGAAPPFDFHSPEGIIYTHMRNLPAARVSGAQIEASLVSDGCRIGAGARLERAALGVRSQIGRNAVLRDVIMLGANYFEAEEARQVPAPGEPPIGVGEGSVLERAIVDKNCRVGRGVRVVNTAKIQEAEGKNYAIRDGIVILPNGAVVPDGTVI